MPYQRSTEEETEGGDRLDVAQDRPAGHAAGTHRLAAIPPVPLRRRGGPTRAHSWLVDRPALQGLKWDDLDFEAGMLQVRRTCSEPKGGYIFEAPKSGKGRNIRLTQS